MVYRWAGESWGVIALPFVVGVLVAFLVARMRATRPSLALLIAAGLFAGSALQRAGHLIAAYGAGAEAAAWAWGVASAFLLPSLALVVAVWRSRRTWALAATGVAGLLVWSGLLVGPLLALTASVGYAWSRWSSNSKRAGRSRPRV